MKKIDLIIQTLQTELVARKKSYFVISQATKILKEKGILTQTDVSKGFLKSALENGMIPQATKTSRKPRQWRIHKENIKPIIDQVEKNYNVEVNKKTSRQDIRGEEKIKSLINTEQSHRSNERQMYFLCPNCGVNVSVPLKYRHHDELKCYNCLLTFKNPIFHQNDNTVYQKTHFRRNGNFSTSNQTKKYLPIGTQIFRGLLAGIIVWVFVKGCTQTPEESMRQYQKEQKSIREYEKKKKEIDEYFEFMGGQE